MENHRLIDAILDLKRKCDFELRIAESSGITTSELFCLVHVSGADPVNANGLCSRMGLSKSRGSRIIGSLVRKGFIASTEDPDDRRMSILVLTGAGKSCVSDIVREKSKCEEMLKTRLSPRKYENAKDSIGALLDVISNGTEE